MERKIGEIFEFGGEWYQCVVAIQGCRECSFRTQDYCTRHSECLSDARSDGISVIFKKLEKVGEPYEYDGHIFQEYHVFEEPIFTENYATIREFGVNSKISIEIKQTKEDMEEKKQKWGVSSDTINEINKGIEPMNTSRNIDTERSRAEGIGRNLKPFNLEAAKQGKPVCTRDGRMARIICFDRKGGTPIVGLIQEDGFETLATFTERGLCLINGAYNLMMLPEKKEGWVNVDKRSNGDVIISKPYPTRDEAIHNSTELTIDTVNIEWEE